MVLVMAYDNLTFVDVPVVQNNVDKSLGAVLGDIESRMSKGHQYSSSDRITWAHETTHGINSKVRNAIYKPDESKNAFYVLEGKALVLREPTHITITQVASKIPQQLRGGVYQQYMVNQAKGWNDRPLYIMDELSAFTNGSMTRTDLKITDRAETVSYMWEMAVYSSYVAMHSKMEELGDGLKFLLDRVAVCYYSSSNLQSFVDEYITKVKDTKELIDYLASVGFRFLENV